MVDAEEDPRVAGALDDAAEDGDFLLRRGREARLPEARDPDRAEAGLLQLLEGRALVPRGVVYGSNQKRGAISVAASAAGQERGGEEARAKNGVLTRSTGRPGRASSRNETES